MIDQTGKVGSYYETKYYFKQAYLRWDYKSIPTYEELINLKLANVTTNFTKTEAITHKGNNECNGFKKSLTQYITEDSWKQQKVYISLQLSTSIPLLQQFTLTNIHYHDVSYDLSETLPVDLTIEVDFDNRLKYNEAFYTDLTNNKQKKYEIECEIPPIIDQVGLFNVTLRSDMHNTTSVQKKSTAFTNTITQKSHRSLINTGSVVTNMLVDITPIELTSSGEDTNVTQQKAPALASMTNNTSQKQYYNIVLGRKHISDISVALTDLQINFTFTNQITLQQYTSPGG